MFSSIRWRIALPYVLLILLTSLTLGIYLSNFLQRSYYKNLEDRLVIEGQIVGEFLQDKLNTDPLDSTQLDQIARQLKQTSGARVTLIGLDGEVIGESDEDRAQMTNHADRPEVKQALQEGRGSSVRFSHTVGYDLLYTAVLYPSKETPLAIIRLAVPINQVQANVRAMRTILFSVTFVVTLLAMLLAAWISGSTSRPIRELTQAVRQMAAGDSGKHTLGIRNNEVDQLTQAFNAMTVRLNEQFNALESEREKLSAVLQKMTDGVLIVDEAGQISLINPAAQQMFSTKNDQVVGQPLMEVLRHHQPYEMWKNSQASGEIQQASFEISKRLVLQGLAMPLGQALPGSFLLLFQDITRQRQIEAMRRDFISNVSHELRTPLAAIKALTETLRDGALDDPPAAKRFLDRMETEVDALSLMVSELLELSRIESGRVPMELKATRPVDIIQTAYDRLCLQAERAHLSLEIACPDTLPLIQADAGRLQQVVVNLLHNAIKFTPAGGKVIVGAESDGPTVRFWVRDTGIGIAAEDLSRIFERFYKVDRARSGSGTGLGLAIARHTVEAHRGKIWAESEINKGSSFYFSIPLA